MLGQTVKNSAWVTDRAVEQFGKMQVLELPALLSAEMRNHYPDLKERATGLIGNLRYRLSK